MVIPRLRHVHGIIPARAGFTRSMPLLKHIKADHPRSRGVYLPDGLPGGLAAVSSPLARGLPGYGVPGARQEGIIPARAGFTMWRCLRSRSRGDHPRSRGVYVVVDAEGAL